MCESLINALGFFEVMGFLFIVLLALITLGVLMESAKGWFPEWRAKARFKNYKRGQAYASGLVSGEFDTDVAMRFGIAECAVTKRERILYGNNMVEEGRAFGSRTPFDEGVESVLRPLWHTLPEEDKFEEGRY
jgi:hypothetical protein